MLGPLVQTPSLIEKVWVPVWARVSEEALMLPPLRVTLPATVTVPVPPRVDVVL